MSPHRFSSRSLTLLLVASGLAALVALFGRGPDAPVADAEPARGALTSRPKPEMPPSPPLAAGAEVRTKSGERRRALLPDGSVLFVNENTVARLDGPRSLKLSAGEIYLETAPAGLTVHAGAGEIAGKRASFSVRVEKAGPAVGVTRAQVEVKGLARAVYAGQQLAAGADEAIPAPRASHALAWLRDLVCAAEVPLLPANPQAGGALVAIDPQGQEAKLTLRRFHVDVHIEDGFARTTIDQTYFNHHSEQLEGTFYFPLPPDASLSRLAMYVNGQLMEGGMAERDHARAVYETIRYARKDPALLEWVDGSTFKMRVFPLEPRQDKRIVLSYSQRLDSLYGKMTYRFPAGHTLQKVGDWSFSARVKDGIGWIWDSPSHKLQAQEEKKDLLLFGAARDAATNRDIVLSLVDGRVDADNEAVQFATAEHEGAKYLLARYRPRLLGKTAAQRRDWTFLVETSGDRDPLLARVQIEVLRHLLNYAGPDDMFAVLAAGTRVKALSKEPLPVTPENIQAAIAFLESAHLIGVLDLGQALTESAAYLKKGSDPHLVHLGSGVAAMGERRDPVLAQQLPDGSRYIGIGVGRRWNRSFMKSAAERTGGHFTQINPDEPIAWRAFELLATINTPRLMDVEVVDQDGKAVFLAFNQAVAQGEEIAAVTRVEGSGTLPKAVVVKGTLDGKKIERVLPVKNAKVNAAYLPRTWAKLEIDRLLADDPVKHKDTIVVLSKSMYVITPFTSLLVLENEDQYVQYKVDRGRKDHWALYPLAEKIPVAVEPDPDAIEAKAGKLPAKKVLQTLAVRGSADGHRAKNGMKKGTDFVLGGSLPARPRVLPDLMLPLGTDWDGAADMPMPNLALGQVSSKLAPSPEPAPEHLRHAMQRARVFFGNGAGKSGDRIIKLQMAISDGDTLAVFQREAGTPMPGTPPPPPLSTLFRNVGWGSNTQPLGFGTEFRSNKEDTFDHAAKFNQVPLRWFEFKPASPAKPPAAEGDGFPDLVDQMERMPQRGSIYERPHYQPAAEVFHDLIAYAPGLHTSHADVLALLDAEALPGMWNKPGKIAAGVRELLNKARLPGWHQVTFPAEAGKAAVTIYFDDTGRYAYDRVLTVGLRERVVCDGKTLTHVYPQLALAALRDVSRFHRAELGALVPWFLPPAEELARGADLTLVGERTIAIVPHGVAGLKKDAVYHVAQLVFDADGRLAARQVVKMPSSETVFRQEFSQDGVAVLIDAKGKERHMQKGKLAASKAPELTADTKDLLVLALPFRASAHVQKALKMEKRNVADLTLKEALPLFLAHVAEGNGEGAQEVFRNVFHAREQRQLGFYVLLASCGVNLDSDHGNVLSEHIDNPLAQYLALHTSPVLRKHASQWAVGSGSWQDGFLQHLAVSHALLQRWQEPKLLKGDPARAAAETRRAIDYIQKNKDSMFGWALLCLIQDRAEDDTALHGKLAELWPLFETQPGLTFAARYETARSLWRAGKKDEAAKRFRALYESAVKDDALPAVDADMRAALLAGDAWGDLMRQTSRKLALQKRRPAILAMAHQCWDLDDQPLAEELLATALAGIAEPAERTAMALAAYEYLRHTAQLPEADRLLQGLLADPKLARQSLVWRLAYELAKQRDMDARAMECLEKALDLEAELPLDVIDLQATRSDYSTLLAHYQALADAIVALRIAPPPEFLSRVIRAADRWRAVDNDPEAACQAAARVAKRLGDRELAWDYLTTPVGLHPNESGPWWSLAGTLGKQGELELADRAFRAAAQAEPTNAQILWDRSLNLKQMGKQQEALQLVRQIAEGAWQPRFQGLQSQAKHLLKRE